MKLDTRLLTCHRGASMRETLALLDGTPSDSARASGYIKERPSSQHVLAVFDAGFTDAGLEIFLPSMRSVRVPFGQFVYFVEVVSGSEKTIQKGYINVTP